MWRVVSQRAWHREGSSVTPGGRPRVLQSAIPWGSASFCRLLSVIFLKKPLMGAPLCGSPTNAPVLLRVIWALSALAPAGLPSLLSAALHPRPSALAQQTASHSQNKTLIPSHGPTSLPNKLLLLGPNHMSTSLALVYGFPIRLGAKSRRESYS